MAKRNSIIPRASSQPQLSLRFLLVHAQTIFIIPPAARANMKNDVRAISEFAGVTKQQMPVAILRNPTMSETHQYLKSVSSVFMILFFDLVQI